MPLIPGLTTHVGKKANQLEKVKAGIEHDPDVIFTEYVDPTPDLWRAMVLPVLTRMPARRLAEETGLAVSTVKAARNGHTTPHEGSRDVLVRVATEYAREQLRTRSVEPPAEDDAACAAFLASKSSLQTR